jgi:hypothetical protein
MTVPVSTATFTGIESLIRAEITVSKGVTPAVALITMLPQDLIELSPGNLEILAGDKSVTFPDAAPVMPSLRGVMGRDGLRWEMHVLDHRWRWLVGTISGEWNKRLPDGTVDPDSVQTPAQLATLLLEAMGESIFDVSRMPEGVYPYVKWNAINPALALASLCEYVACEVTGGEFNHVVIHRRGLGDTLPVGGDPTHDSYRFISQAKPKRIIVAGGPTMFQSKLLLEPIAREAGGDTYDLDLVSYNPDWADEDPWTLPNLTDGDDLDAGADSAWRWYRIVGQADGSLPVPGSPEPVTDIVQYLPLQPQLLDTGNDPSFLARSLPAYVAGEFWPYSDAIENTASGTRYVGPWQLLGDRGYVVFPLPVHSLASDGSIAEPALFLHCTHGVRRQDGQGYTSFLKEQAIGGSQGDLVLRRFEIFSSVTILYSGPSIVGQTSTVAQADAEAAKYLDLFKASLTTATIDDREYAGLELIPLDGNVAQVRYSFSVHEGPKTRASTVREFDIYSPFEVERRRNELVQQLREALLV